MRNSISTQRIYLFKCECGCCYECMVYHVQCMCQLCHVENDFGEPLVARKTENSQLDLHKFAYHSIARKIIIYIFEYCAETRKTKHFYRSVVMVVAAIVADIK